MAFLKPDARAAFIKDVAGQPPDPEESTPGAAEAAGTVTSVTETTTPETTQQTATIPPVATTPTAAKPEAGTTPAAPATPEGQAAPEFTPEQLQVIDARGREMAMDYLKNIAEKSPSL